MDLASDISTLIPSASGAPAAFKDSTAASSAGWFLAITATQAPSAARVSATARPIPLLPPVTTAFEPANPKSIVAPLADEVAVSAVSNDCRDHVLGGAKPTQAETQHRIPGLGPIAVSGSPLLLDTRPDRSVQQLGVGWWIDLREDSLSLAEFQLLQQRAEQLAVCRAHHLGCRKHLGLGLQRQVP